MSLIKMYATVPVIYALSETSFSADIKQKFLQGETFFYQTHITMNREMHLQNVPYRQMIL